MNYYNWRNSRGQFCRKNEVLSEACNYELPPQKNTIKIVPGRLYQFKGTVVRAASRANGKRVVTVHKSLMGLVDEAELALASGEQVNHYLQHAD